MSRAENDTILSRKVSRQASKGLTAPAASIYSGKSSFNGIDTPDTALRPSGFLNQDYNQDYDDSFGEDIVKKNYEDMNSSPDFEQSMAQPLGRSNPGIFDDRASSFHESQDPVPKRSSVGSWSSKIFKRDSFDKIAMDISMGMSNLFRRRQSSMASSESEISESPEHPTQTSVASLYRSNNNSISYGEDQAGIRGAQLKQDDSSQSIQDMQSKQDDQSMQEMNLSGTSSTNVFAPKTDRLVLLKSGASPNFRGQVPGAFQASGRAFGEHPIWGQSREISGISFDQESLDDETDFDPLFSDDDRNLMGHSEISHFPSQEEEQEEMHSMPAFEASFQSVLSEVKPQHKHRKWYILSLISLCIIFVGSGIGISKAFANRTNGVNMERSCGPESELPLFEKCSLCSTNTTIHFSTLTVQKYQELQELLVERNIITSGGNHSILDNSVCSNPQVYALIDMALSNNTDLTRYALIIIYMSLDGNSWRKNEGWLNSSSACLWHGVTCNNDESAVKLELANNLLSGQLPTEIGILSTLTTIDLAQNNGGIGTIPSEIGNLKNLTHLDLGQAELTGTIPTEIGKLNSLVTFKAHQNLLDGILPSELEYLQNLETLYLNRNTLQGQLPNWLGNLKMLRELWLGQNNFELGTITEDILRLPMLRSLDLVHSSRTGTLALGGLLQSKTIRSLELEGHDLTGTLFSEIGLLTNLVKLNIAGGQLVGTLPTEIGSLTLLEELGVARNNFRGSIPLELANLTSLDNLSINGNEQLTGDLSHFCEVRISLGLGNLEEYDSISFGLKSIPCDCC